MNYISQINGFWEEVERLEGAGVVFKSQHISVYFTLLKKCNDLGWKVKFNVNKNELLKLSKVSKNTLYDTIKFLSTHKLIYYNSRKDIRKSPEFKLRKLYKDELPKTEKNTNSKAKNYPNGSPEKSKILPKSEYKILSPKAPIH